MPLEQKTGSKSRRNVSVQHGFTWNNCTIMSKYVQIHIEHLHHHIIHGTSIYNTSMKTERNSGNLYIPSGNLSRRSMISLYLISQFHRNIERQITSNYIEHHRTNHDIEQLLHRRNDKSLLVMSQCIQSSMKPPPAQWPQWRHPKCRRRCLRTWNRCGTMWHGRTRHGVARSSAMCGSDMSLKITENHGKNHQTYIKSSIFWGTVRFFDSQTHVQMVDSEMIW